MCPRRSDVPHDVVMFPTTCACSPRHACVPHDMQMHIVGNMSWGTWLQHVVGNMRHVVGNISANVPHDMLCSPRHAHDIGNILMFPTTCTPRHVFVPHDIICVPHDVSKCSPRHSYVVGNIGTCRGEHMSWGTPTHVVGNIGLTDVTPYWASKARSSRRYRRKPAIHRAMSLRSEDVSFSHCGTSACRSFPARTTRMC